MHHNGSNPAFGRYSRHFRLAPVSGIRSALARCLSRANKRNSFDHLVGAGEDRRRQLDSAGKVDAAYFNPSPLPFSKADAALNGNTVNLFFELRAGGYAGSTYTLTYDPTRDQLVGVYFQAVAQQEFEIYFIRIR